MILAVSAAIASGASLTAAAETRPNIFHITAYEKAACGSDAARMCAYTYPDERELLGCMKTNRSALGASCRVAFDTGLKRRHLE